MTVELNRQVCGFDEKSIAELETRMSDFASKGYRALAVAKTNDQEHPELVGLVALHDPPRPDSKQLIDELRNLGISVKILTGDALPMAREIAADVGLGENIVRVADLKECLKEDAMEATDVAAKSDGFAEIYPEDKYAIVKSLQATKHVVGMTGDGVNDAPRAKASRGGHSRQQCDGCGKGCRQCRINE